MNPDPQQNYLNPSHLELLQQLNMLIRGRSVIDRLTAVGAAAPAAPPPQLPTLTRLPPVLLPDPVDLVVHLIAGKPERRKGVMEIKMKSALKRVWYGTYLQYLSPHALKGLSHQPFGGLFSPAWNRK